METHISRGDVVADRDSDKSENELYVVSVLDKHPSEHQVTYDWNGIPKTVADENPSEFIGDTDCVVLCVYKNSVTKEIDNPLTYTAEKLIKSILENNRIKQYAFPSSRLKKIEYHTE